MKKKLQIKLTGIFLLSLAIFISLSISQVNAQNCDEINCSKGEQSEDHYLTCIKEKQSCLESKIQETRESAVTLSNTINILNGQVALQQLQIDQTLTEIEQLEKEITDLSNRIDGLGLSLDKLSNILIERIRGSYKQQRTNNLFALSVNHSFTQFISEYKYLKKAEQQTAQAMQLAETQRLNYKEQKRLKETKQEELESKQAVLQQQQITLTQRKAEQQYLLTETKNNESKYQSELAKTLSELQAIQSIIAGKGVESEIGDINQGDTIASIIRGASACSTGTHLHFEVVKDGAHRNPASYLKNVDISWDNAPDGSFGFSGSWEWPVHNPARITQGYGMTYYARVKRFYGGQPHTGLDMVSKGADYRIRAVKNGKLYRGSIKCGGGYLRYVKVEHKEDGMNSYYLHINY